MTRITESISEMSFNSKLGSIKSRIVCERYVEIALFQFQTGSIKRSEPHLEEDSIEVFQFQTGSIKKPIFKAVCVAKNIGFNSKLVRLKSLRYTVPRRVCVQGFNSKLVRLKDWPQISIAEVLFRFNSKLVRLKVKP